MHGVFNDANLDARHLIPMLLDRGDAIFKMLLDPRSQLSSFANEQKLLLAVVEHENPAPVSRNQVEIRKSVNMAQFRSILLGYGDVRLGDGYIDHD